MKISCKIVKSLYQDEDENIVTYGLAFYRFGSDNPFRIIKNIFTNKNQIYTLCNLININGLDEMHIDDAIDDAIDETVDYLFMKSHKYVG